MQKLTAEVDQIKERGSVEFNKGMYEDAVTIFELAVRVLEKEISKFTHLKKDIIYKEAVIYSNIAACYKQTQHNKKEAEYSTKVIERAPYL